MSWIQNFFQRFKNDEEDENDYEYELNHSRIHNEMRDFPSKKNNEGGRDIDARISYQYPKGKIRLPIIPDEKSIENKGAASKKRTERQQKSKETEHFEVVQEKKAAPKIQKEQEPKKSRPFHATEIPSPVFGFKRPVKSSNSIIVEHELTHFIKEDTESTQNSQKMMEEIQVPPQEQNENPVILVTEPGPLVEEIEKEEDSRLEPSLNISYSIPDREQEIPSVQAVEPENLPPQISVETVQVHTENPRPKQSHLPFNVMMLKQDKEKWEERKIQRKMGMDSRIPPEINKPIETVKKVKVVHEELKEVPIFQIEKAAPKKEAFINDEIKVHFEEATTHDEPDAHKEEATTYDEPDAHKEEATTYDEPDAHKEEATTYDEPDAHKEEATTYDEPDAHKEEAATYDKTVAHEEVAISAADTYQFPEFSLLSPPVVVEKDTEWIQNQENLLNQTLQNFNVGAKVVNVTQGPAVTRFEVQPEPGVKVNKITNLSDDIKLSLAARDIRIEAPIPGKHTIGIEVPNQKSRPVFINEIIQSNVFKESTSPLTAVLGLDISGKPIVTDLKKMPHGLIAGATGSGKSVCINTILVSLLFKASPEDLKLLLIDPKMVELAPYNRIPHLVSPVITDVKAATAALKWAVEEMERRYELFAHTGVRDINRFNELAMEHKRYSDKLPFIVIIIDELADLMMMSPADVEEAICRIAQKARACGIHLIVATQRPSVDVITGLIKANIPTRIAFSVSSQIDSRTIIDISGAEKLLGRGDMLFLENGSSKPVRLQGTFVSDEEIDLVVAHVREQQEPDYLFEQEELLKKAQVTEEEDELFYEACEFIIDHGTASTSSLQRRFKIGYNRAARLMDMLEANGFISSANGSKPREVLITASDLEAFYEANSNG
ncbi:DNA translocase FtsK [Bacillus salipaludis]|uniref:DNA translocase FtsK n=1 Tax=Bacillus salipaludis TaxID=2547811 RepID=A0A4R5VRS5_9BACI|nr:DNA translocase FtsK [Bacillus salipaludis]TDK61434.1 DNA translocase FtsK [Bacillus salipaludis]